MSYRERYQKYWETDNVLEDGRGLEAGSGLRFALLCHPTALALTQQEPERQFLQERIRQFDKK